MAQRRMFSLQVVDTDAFLDMGQGSQLLYFHLAMRADDDGFLSNPKKVAKMIGASEDDMKVLLAKRFVIGFESGVVVIKHWRMHNYIRKDTYNETNYLEEKSTLQVKENGSYTEIIPSVNGSSTGRQRVVDTGKVRLGKDRIGKVSVESEATIVANSPKEQMKRFIEGENREAIIKYLTQNGLDESTAIQEIQKFIQYWTEPNHTGTKERWQLQKTFDVKRRLITWFSKSKQFNQITNEKKGIIL